MDRTDQPQSTRPRRVAKRLATQVEDETLAAIREIVEQEATEAVAEQRQPPQRANLRLIEPAPPPAGRAPVAGRQLRGFRMFRRKTHARPQPAKPAARTSVTGRVTRAVGRLVLRFLRRPDAPRLIATAVLAFLVFTWPGRVVGLAVTAALALMALYMAIGYDRLAEWIYHRYLKIKARDPERAEALRLRAVAITKRLEHWTSRLPQSWTQGLYLPEFEEPQPLSGKMLDDPFDKLARQAGQTPQTEA